MDFVFSLLGIAVVMALLSEAVHGCCQPSKDLRRHVWRAQRAGYRGNNASLLKPFDVPVQPKRFSPGVTTHHVNPALGEGVNPVLSSKSV